MDVCGDTFVLQALVVYVDTSFCRSMKRWICFVAVVNVGPVDHSVDP